MRQPDVRYATASREWGLRRVRRLTWAIAGTGAAGAVILAVGFGGHVHLPRTGQPASSGQSSAGNAGSNTGSQVPGGGQQLQAPPVNPLPAQGGGQVVSGGS
ncbi:MAG: hypothetical protein ACM3ML_23800 [Micromonosporaceae bacterium]